MRPPFGRLFPCRVVQPRPYLELAPHVSRKDILEAWRLYDSTREEPTKGGRTPRPLLRCAESALLHDRLGWTYEQIAAHFGWQDHMQASKYINDGRKALG